MSRGIWWVREQKPCGDAAKFFREKGDQIATLLAQGCSIFRVDPHALESGPIFCPFFEALRCQTAHSTGACALRKPICCCNVAAEIGGVAIALVQEQAHSLRTLSWWESAAVWTQLCGQRVKKGGGHTAVVFFLLVRVSLVWCVESALRITSWPCGAVIRETFRRVCASVACCALPGSRHVGKERLGSVCSISVVRLTCVVRLFLAEGKIEAQAQVKARRRC